VINVNNDISNTYEILRFDEEKENESIVNCGHGNRNEPWSKQTFAFLQIPVHGSSSSHHYE
jgi:hypothetical protein